ncbi:MAG: hypothetical protein IKB70_12660 [Bacilli bacterium]|nr:hypothetical protein [Bacilli bacterium]
MEKKLLKVELEENQIKLSEKELKEILGGTSAEDSEDIMEDDESDIVIPICATTKRCTFNKKSRA